MRIARVRTPAGPRFGYLVGNHVRLAEGELGSLQETGEEHLFHEDMLLAPVAPSKVIAVATNYAAHAAEMGKPIPDEPRIFLKPSTAVCGPGDVIALPEESTRVDPEAELAVVIGQRIARGYSGNPMDAVLGYTIGNDVTARDFQKKDVIFGRAKGYDTFCPLGPWIETDLDPRDLRVTLHVNGELRQDGRTSDMVFDVAKLVAFIANFMTLLPGDVILTGTPPGVAPIHPGDRLSLAIDGIGTLENTALRA